VPTRVPPAYIPSARVPCSRLQTHHRSCRLSARRLRWGFHWRRCEDLDACQRHLRQRREALHGGGSRLRERGFRFTASRSAASAASAASSSCLACAERVAEVWVQVAREKERWREREWPAALSSKTRGSLGMLRSSSEPHLTELPNGTYSSENHALVEIASRLSLALVHLFSIA
jgi:hypothetical protein